MFNKKDLSRNEFMLTGKFKKKGYDWWWHSFTAINEVTGEERPFFIEFFLCNPDLTKKEPTLGQLKTNKENNIKPSYLMVKAGCWGENAKQLHRFFSWKDISVNYKTPYSIEASDCFASEDILKGKINLSEEAVNNHPEYMCSSGSIEWNLKIDKKIAFNVGYGASKFFRFIKAFEMYWHAEGMKSLFEGYLILDGIRYKVIKEKSYGYSDKNWGSNFTSPWVWLSSNNLVSNITNKKLENSVFDIGGGRPKIYFFPLERKLLGGFYYEGEEYEFNFSKFWTGFKTDFSYEETEDEIIWDVVLENRKALMETKVKCKKKDMLFINYEAPDGSKRHNNLWNGGNAKGRILLYKKTKKGKVLIDDINAYTIGCEYAEYDK